MTCLRVWGREQSEDTVGNKSWQMYCMDVIRKWCGQRGLGCGKEIEKYELVWMCSTMEVLYRVVK